MSNIVNVILSGGAGTRLWPMSRELFPKQFQPISSGLSLLQETALRFPASSHIVVCNVNHKHIVENQLREINAPAMQLLAEPIGRSTAPAVAVAALYLETVAPDALLLVMPSDHKIDKVAAFREAVAKAAGLAEQGYLVLFGVSPSTPHTGFGYVEVGAELSIGHAVAGFREKPSQETAKAYLRSGRFLWNSGIFLFSVATILKEYEQHCPALLEGCRQAIQAGRPNGNCLELAKDVFSAVVGDSIDKLIMEKTGSAAVIPVDLGWSDLGSWSALKESAPNDANGNALIGDVVAVDTSGSYVRSDRQLVATLGINDLIVVATDDVVLVANKDSDQKLKDLVGELKLSGRPEATQSVKVHRPWGWYKVIEEGDRFRVKKIVVQPGETLSLQKHWHRSEHWIVLQGTALVTSGDKSFVLRENESTFIQAGTVHRLENPGKLPLHLIEVQSGAYIGEDDIVRYNDIYGRSE